MKLVTFETGADRPRPGLLTERGVAGILALGVVDVINRFAELQPELERLAQYGSALPLEEVRLLAPIPRPGKILCCIANYWEHAQREPRPLNMFLKNPDAVIGDGDTVRLPAFTVPWMFMHEAELAIIVKGPAKGVPEPDWRSGVFGYTGLMDITGRGEGCSTWGRGTWIGKIVRYVLSDRSIHHYCRRDRRPQ